MDSIGASSCHLIPWTQAKARFSLRRAEVNWIGCQAFLRVLKRKPTSHGNIVRIRVSNASCSEPRTQIAAMKELQQVSVAAIEAERLQLFQSAMSQPDSHVLDGILY